MVNNKVIKITAVLNKGISFNLIELLKQVNVQNINLNAGRTLTLHEKRKFFGLIHEAALTEAPVEIISFLIDADKEDEILSFIIEKAELNVPGRGSVYSEEIKITKAHPLCMEDQPVIEKEKSGLIQSDLLGICCIVNKGQGNSIARTALDSGISVPVITYGEGTGFRNKIGLLRITIPAEKEVVNVLASSYDAETLMNLMIDIGKLDQPGKGFIYLYPIRKGVLNTRIIRGDKSQVASIEQIVSVLDEIKGNMDWRRKSEVRGRQGEKRLFLNNLVNFVLTCNEGRGELLIKEAMKAGAPGATIRRLRNISAENIPQSKISPAREFCNMIVSQNQIPGILKAIEDSGGFSDEDCGQILSSPVPKAYTYIGK